MSGYRHEHTCRLHPLECNTTTCNLRHSLHPRGVKQYILTALESSLIFGVSAMEGGAAVSPECESAGARAKCLQSVIAICNCNRMQVGISQDLIPRAHTRPPLALRTCLMVTACRGPRTADRRRQDIRAARLLPCRSKLIEKIVPTDRERSATNPPQLMLGYNCRCSAAIADRLQIHSAGFPPKGWIRAKIAQLQMQIANTLCRLPRPRGDRNKKSSVAIGDCKYRTLSAGISP